MSIKCNECNNSQIESVMFHSIVLEKCLDCNYFRIDGQQYNKLIFNCLYEENIAGVKKYFYVSEISEEDMKKIQKFSKYFVLSSFKMTNGQDIVCNRCKTNLVEFKNKYLPSFKIYYCSYCDSIYFNKDAFNNFLKHIISRTKYSLLERIKRFFIKG